MSRLQIRQVAGDAHVPAAPIGPASAHDWRYPRATPRTWTREEARRRLAEVQAAPSRRASHAPGRLTFRVGERTPTGHLVVGHDERGNNIIEGASYRRANLKHRGGATIVWDGNR